VTSVLKREQLKREAAQQAKAVWEKREDLANLKRKFPSLLNAKEDEELFYDKEKVVKKPKTEPTYVHGYCRRVHELIDPTAVSWDSGSSRETTMATLYLRRRTTRLLFVQRNVLRRSSHKSIARWPGSKSAITIGKMGSRYALYLSRIDPCLPLP